MIKVHPLVRRVALIKIKIQIRTGCDRWLNLNAYGEFKYDYDDDDWQRRKLNADWFPIRDIL